MRMSKSFQVRRNTVVEEGEVLIIRKLVVAGIVAAEKSYIECLNALKEVGGLHQLQVTQYLIITDNACTCTIEESIVFDIILVWDMLQCMLLICSYCIVGIFKVHYPGDFQVFVSPAR